MGKTLYLECYSGISGDMTVAALLDLGMDEEILLDGLESLGIGGFHIEINRVLKAGIDACNFDVILEDDDFLEEELPEELLEEEPYEILYEEDLEEDHHEHHHSHEHHDHHHNDDTNHAHDHHHDHEHEHIHRNINDINTIIANSDISNHAKEIAYKIFEIIAKAESKAHALPIEEVHFHEVGAIDSIVDVIATAICIDALDIDEIIIPKLYEGQGYVKCQHGAMPVPVPAVVNIVTEHSIRMKITNNQGEMITPTGAAIVAATRTSDTLPKDYLIKKVGLGAGKREYNHANILRAFIIEI